MTVNQILVCVWRAVVCVSCLNVLHHGRPLKIEKEGSNPGELRL